MMPPCMVQPGLAQLGVELQGKVLIGDFFGMGEGQTEEQPVRRIDMTRMTRGQRLPGIAPGQCIGRIHPGRATKALRGNWSVRIRSARAPSDVCIQPS